MRIDKLFSKKKISKILANNKGSAMITALVVGIIVFAFCLSMLLVAYTLFAQTSRTEVQLGCKNIAQSTAEELRMEISDKSSELYNFLKNEYPDTSENESVVMNLSTTGGELDRYYVTVTFDKVNTTQFKAKIDCQHDFGNFKEVQSYTVRTEYNLND